VNEEEEELQISDYSKKRKRNIYATGGMGIKMGGGCEERH